VNVPHPSQIKKRGASIVADKLDEPKLLKDTDEIKKNWTFEQSPEAAEARAKITGHFWETLHIDLRMVDTADFVVAYCPTNIYSVGTPHEIALARLERKPVLLVSPPITFPTLNRLKEHLKADSDGTKILTDFIAESGVQENAHGVPSLWYTTLVGGDGFFDGFGFAPIWSGSTGPGSPWMTMKRPTASGIRCSPFSNGLTSSCPRNGTTRSNSPYVTTTGSYGISRRRVTAGWSKDRISH
jgi:hypothetical protein